MTDSLAARLFSGNVEAALESSGKACKLGPDCWACFHNRAAALFASGSLQEAAKTAAEALTRLPGSAAPCIAAALAQALFFYNSALRDPAAVEGKPLPDLIAP